MRRRKPGAAFALQKTASDLASKNSTRLCARLLHSGPAQRRRTTAPGSTQPLGTAFGVGRIGHTRDSWREKSVCTQSTGECRCVRHHRHFNAAV